MSAASRKRPRPEPEDNRAECPFSVRVVDPKEKDPKKKKRRRTDGEDEDTAAPRMPLQMSPFTPTGRFKTHETMDLYYQVDPPKKWTDMTRYNSFVLNGHKYFSEGFIHVANDSSVERTKAVGSKEHAERREKSDADWVARILEIRASDEHHVYARVYWMYWPDELPPGTIDGKKVVQGRQAYHGANELIASNHMDIINVVSVTAPAKVNQWFEENDEDIQDALYWRQAFDVRTYELSGVELVCKCAQPGNPDKTLIGCTTEPCKQWLHEECIKHDALLDTYKRLGKDKPHLSEPVKDEKVEKAQEEEKRPLSPTESGAAVSAQQSIDVKQTSDVTTSDNVEVKGPNHDATTTTTTATAAAAAAAAAAQEGHPSEADLAPATATEIVRSQTPSKSTPTRPGPAKKPGRWRKRAGESDSRPYEGLFDITLRMDLTPPLLEFRDLREGVVGGEQTWTEPIKCLVCGAQVN